mmetsp:Transcript_11844/g.30906  ORF Transcript_11844/g.30906 Transcript_11844/m.30906 type:complete len:137 (-) Transcript_11844:499-909(-)
MRIGPLDCSDALGMQGDDIRVTARLPTSPVCHTDTPANSPTLFGGGFFDDAGDLPGSPVIFFTLRGKWDALTNAVLFTKHYESAKVPVELTVEYKGHLQPRGPDGQPVLSGTWTNTLEGVTGTFACRLEPRNYHRV